MTKIPNPKFFHFFISFCSGAAQYMFSHTQKKTIPNFNQLEGVFYVLFHLSDNEIHLSDWMPSLKQPGNNINIVCIIIIPFLNYWLWSCKMHVFTHTKKNPNFNQWIMTYLAWGRQGLFQTFFKVVFHKSHFCWPTCCEVDEPRGYRITRGRHQGEADLVWLANSNAFYGKQLWRMSEIALASPKPNKS